jgi:hypothetical protein
MTAKHFVTIATGTNRHYWKANLSIKERNFYEFNSIPQCAAESIRRTGGFIAISTKLILYKTLDIQIFNCL